MSVFEELQELSNIELVELQKYARRKRDNDLEILASEEVKNRNLVNCDMCYTAIIDTGTKVEIQALDWDLCHSCWEKFHPTWVFLTIGIGLDIDFKVRK